ncbi:DNA polymerase III subunit gamma/tau [Spiroplasma endosymbiont of Danaus chrysippus]|uniref:DNA polymerase III subunit gamma/tau n=1 Tax=Spiroplasma endosymbiont of Danaus chrysippus TaxID=2691041 RepID=UPI0013C58968|nr:DNA polymerase III subunit gamma/tau [Spiroplasma endosymbiont of Danaus chrysippus]CAB1054937.1 DNA polymerase III subunits gamma and tau (EC 2.7.7.7) [Spiroplasma endosymbiont of Danaus chrysippus]
MKHKSFYRKYRPNSFSEIISQDNIVRILKNSILNNSFNHAYLFSGSKGTGKTSTAKIFAKAINCQNNIDGDACNTCENCINISSNNCIDILEIDGASNNGVDEIRSIRDNINLLPMNFKYKVYIIDEVHMLTTSAFNALLKTLEEPPQHIIFILATTEPYKVIPTIISRCLWFEFKKINVNETKKHFIDVLTKEKINFEVEAVEELAILSEGSLRDGLNYLEKTFNYGNNITLKNVEKIFSVLSTKNKILFLINIFNCNIEQVIKQLTLFDEYTIQYKKNIIDFIYILEEILIYAITKKTELLKMINIQQVNIFSEVVKSDLLLILNSFNDILIQEDVDDLKPTLILKILNLIKNFENKYSLNYLEKTKISIMNIENKSINLNSKDEITKILKKSEIDKNNEELTSILVKEENTSIKEKEIFNVPTVKNLKNDEIIDKTINLILQADKNIRKEVSEKWKNISKFINDNKFRNITKVYINTIIAAASTNGIIIITKNIIQSDLINQSFLSKEHREFLNILLENEYMIYALDKNQWQETRKKYQELLTKKILPKPVDIVISKPVIESFTNVDRDPTLNFIKKIFTEIEEI